LMMKFAGGTLFQKDQMNPAEFLKQADLYEEVDVNLLDRVYKLFMVSAVNHPLIIVRSREIVTWADGSEYRDIYEGRYPRKPGVPGYNGNRPGAGTTTATEEPSSGAPEQIRCPHCGRDQTNHRYCSLCGGTIS